MPMPIPRVMRPSVFEPLFSLNNSRRIPRAACAAALASLATPLALDVSPHRDDAVADKFIECAVVPKNDVGHRGQVFIQLPDQFFFVRFLTQSGETDDVGEK